MGRKKGAIIEYDVLWHYSTAFKHAEKMVLEKSHCPKEIHGFVEFQYWILIFTTNKEVSKIFGFKNNMTTNFLS